MMLKYNILWWKSICIHINLRNNGHGIPLSIFPFRRYSVGVKSQQMRAEGSGEGLTDVNEGQVVPWDVREVIYSKTVTPEPQEAVFCKFITLTLKINVTGHLVWPQRL